MNQDNNEVNSVSVNPSTESTVSPVNESTTVSPANVPESSVETGTQEDSSSSKKTFKDVMNRVTVTDPNTGKQRTARQQDVALALSEIYSREEYSSLKANGEKLKSPKVSTVTRGYFSKQVNGNMALSAKFVKAFTLWAKENGVEEEVRTNK